MQASRAPAAKEGLTFDRGLQPFLVIKSLPSSKEKTRLLPSHCLGPKSVSKLEGLPGRDLGKKKKIMPKSLSICQLPLQVPPGITGATFEGDSCLVFWLRRGLGWVSPAVSWLAGHSL